VVPGAADRSYGIQVAKLAGLPPALIARARQVLAKLEKSQGKSRGGLEELPLFAMLAAPPEDEPAPPESNPLTEALAALDPDRMTPRDALDALYRLKELAGK
jgi:DNA mismatch repair protein MutS